LLTPTWSTGPRRDDTGVLVIDAGSRQRQEVLDSVHQLGFGIDDIHAFLLTTRTSTTRFGDLVREKPWHAGLLPCRRGRHAHRDTRAGVTGGLGDQVVATELPEVDVEIALKGALNAKASDRHALTEE